MEKTIFIHIGLHKTATSAIQLELANLNKSSNRNWHYLVSARNKKLNKHLRLFDAIIDDGFNTQRRKRIKYNKVKENITKEIQNTSYKYYFISEEELSYPDKRIPKKLDFLGSLGKVVVIFIVRNQVSFFDSLYRQFITQTGLHLIDDFDSFIQKDINKKRGMFFEIAESWGEVFGRENILVQDFDKLRSDKGVLSNFFQITGCNYRPKNKNTKEVNPSISAVHAEFIRRLATKLPNLDRRPIVKYFKSDKNSKQLSGENLITKERSDTIANSYQESNNLLKENYNINLSNKTVTYSSKSDLEYRLAFEHNISKIGIDYIAHTQSKP